MSARSADNGISNRRHLQVDAQSALQRRNGIALVFALDWLLLLIVPSVLLLHFGVVKREEQYLERKFGDQYRHYKLNVARYGLEI
jgi:protein-S-isoprenylcysteine O-methyltransferase Ste14